VSHSGWWTERIVYFDLGLNIVETGIEQSCSQAYFGAALSITRHLHEERQFTTGR